MTALKCSLKLLKVLRVTDLASCDGIRTVWGANGEGLDRIRQLLFLGQFHQCSSDQTGVQTTWKPT